GRHGAHRGERVGVGAIERVHEWIRHAANDEAVNAAAVRTCSVWIKTRVVVNGRVVVFEIELLNRRTAHREIEFPADAEQRVMELLCIEPRPVHAPEETVL